MVRVDVTKENTVAFGVMRASGEDHEKNLLPALVLSALTGVLIFAAANTGWLSRAFAPLVIGAGAGILFAALRDWRAGVKALLIIIVFEGALRKWFFSSASDFVYFYKDLVMVALLIGYCLQRKKPPFVLASRMKVSFAIASILMLYSAAQIANPRAPHPMVSLLGIKSYFLYMPLALIVPRMFTTKEDVYGFLRWFLILVLPVVFIGVVQFAGADANSSVNKYAWDAVQREMGPEASSVASFEDSAGNSYVRVTGTFSYISGMAIYLPVVYALLLGFVSLDSYQQLSRVFRALYYAIFAGVVATGFMTGSRSTVAAMIIITLVFFGLTSHATMKRRLVQFGLMAGAVLIVLAFLFPEALNALKTRTVGSDEQVEEGSRRISDLFSVPLEESSYAGALGYGIGATQNYVPALVEKLELSNWGEALPPIREDEPHRVMLELGVVGYVLYCLLRFALIISLWQTCLSLKDSGRRSLAVAICAVLTIHLFVGGAVVVHTQNVLQWFLIGTCLALANGETLRRESARLLQLNSRFGGVLVPAAFGQ